MYKHFFKRLIDVFLSFIGIIILAFPMRLLCDEDCPGLCPKCGKPKREGECGCPTREIDPRLAVLATLLQDEEKE